MDLNNVEQTFSKDRHQTAYYEAVANNGASNGDGVKPPKKPLYGQPCNRCGICCASSTCPLGQMVLHRGPEGPCPALEWQWGTWRPDTSPGQWGSCGLIAHPKQYFPVASLLHGVKAVRDALLLVIGSNGFCDMLDAPEDFAAHKELWSYYAGRREVTREAVKLLGLPVAEDRPTAEQAVRAHSGGPGAEASAASTT